MARILSKGSKIVTGCRPPGEKKKGLPTPCGLLVAAKGRPLKYL